MNSKAIKKEKLLILFILGVWVSITPIFIYTVDLIERNTTYGLEYNTEFVMDYNERSFSAISGRININGSLGWANAKTEGICVGNGTYSNPYIIEDLVIDGEHLGSGIFIQNSEVYFRIENCTIYNTGAWPPHGGIRLNSVDNGQLVDNNISSSSTGIKMYDCDNNTISENILYDNYWGIDLGYCDKNNIFENHANYSFYGIDIHRSHYNNISRNIINISDIGIRIYMGYNNILRSNNVYNSVNEGILLHGSKKTNLTRNIMKGCPLVISSFSMIYPYSKKHFGSHNIDSTNLVNVKPIYYYTNKTNLKPHNFSDAGQIILYNCSNSMILNANISHVFSSVSIFGGISLFYCNNNTVLGNFVSNNSFGIYLSYSNDNNITRNIAINNYCDVNSSYYHDFIIYSGIYLSNSDRNTISKNIIENNYGGIYLISSDYNQIKGNNVTYNYRGIFIDYNDYNFISRNNVSFNHAAITMYFCNRNKVIDNIANDNSYGITFGYCNKNNVTNNIVNNNFRGIYLGYSCNNTVTGNIANNNRFNGNGAGISLFYSNYNNVTGNTLIGNDICIVEVDCYGNYFSDNYCCIYGQGDGNSFDWIIILMILIGCAVMGLATLLLIGFKRRR